MFGKVGGGREGQRMAVKVRSGCDGQDGCESQRLIAKVRGWLGRSEDGCESLYRYIEVLPCLILVFITVRNKRSSVIFF